LQQNESHIAYIILKTEYMAQICEGSWSKKVTFLPAPLKQVTAPGLSSQQSCAGGGSCGGRRRPLEDANLPEGGRDSMSGPSLAVSAGHGVDDACLNAFLAAALQRVVREAELVQVPASAYVVPSASVRGFDTGVLGGIAASVAGRVGELAAVCRERVIVGAAGRPGALLRVELPGPHTMHALAL